MNTQPKSRIEAEPGETANPPHPGELLSQGIGLVGRGSPADRLGVPAGQLAAVMDGKDRISADLAVRFEQAGMSTA